MHRLVPLLVAALVVAACSSDDPAADTPATTTPTTVSEAAEATGAEPDTAARTPPAPTVPTEDLPVFEPDEIAWEQLDEQVDVGTLRVPIDYTDPAGGQIELALARFRALDTDNRIGTLLVNRGGPGFPSTDYAIFAPQIFDREIIEHFDVVAWDPRGVGESEPAIDCIDDYDRFFTAIDSTPDSDDERGLLVDLAEEFAAECVANNADIIDHVGTNSSARDMDAIRRSVGEDTISYFGFSYGSELGAAWATLFPDTVRAAVLDGASDPAADPLESSLQQVRGFAASLDAFLADCSADDDCAFHNEGDPAGALDELLRSLDERPLPSRTDRPPVNRDVAQTAITQAMYLDSYWPALALSLAAAQENGDGSGLLELYDAYFERRPDGTYGNELEAFQVISCADRADRSTVADADAEMAQITEAAPRLVPEGTVGSYFCTFFPTAADPRVEIDTTGAGPIVVIGTTGDPATPFESTVRMAETLEDGRLVIVEADQHTGYGVNRCVIDVVNDYLINENPPDNETRC